MPANQTTPSTQFPANALLTLLHVGTILALIATVMFTNRSALNGTRFLALFGSVILVILFLAVILDDEAPEMRTWDQQAKVYALGLLVMTTSPWIPSITWLVFDSVVHAGLYLVCGLLGLLIGIVMIIWANTTPSK